MATIQGVFTKSTTKSGKTLTGRSTLTANYNVTETDDTLTITQTSHSYTTPTYSGTTGDEWTDTFWKTGFVSACITGSNLFVNRSLVGDNQSRSFTKTHSPQTVQLSLVGELAARTLTIPAKTSYAVELTNAVGATYQTITKWYNEALTLPRMEEDGYTFLGWATTEAKAKAGEVDYLPTEAYTANAATTLYGVFELTYTKPSIGALSINRCTAQGTDDDEGEYAKVTFDWSVYRSTAARYLGGNTYPYANNGSEVTVTVGTHTATDTSTDESGTYSIVVGEGDYDQDVQYEVSVELTDTQQVVIDKTTTATGVLATSYFPIDFNADGSAMGIFRPAPDNDEGVFIGKHLAVKGNVGATGNLQGANVIAAQNLQGENALLALDTTEPPDTTTTDGQIYQALKDLGWDSDVIV